MVRRRFLFQERNLPRLIDPFWLTVPSLNRQGALMSRDLPTASSLLITSLPYLLFLSLPSIDLTGPGEVRVSSPKWERKEGMGLKPPWKRLSSLSIFLRLKKEGMRSPGTRQERGPFKSPKRRSRGLHTSHVLQGLCLLWTGNSSFPRSLFPTPISLSFLGEMRRRKGSFLFLSVD